MSILATKTIEQIQNEQLGDSHSGGLPRVLGPSQLIMLGVGAIIGTGIFVLTGTAAANQAGPAISMSYLAAGLACAFAALCYAEFASMIPIAGSAYTYAYATLGELVAWMIGWDLILEYAVGSMTVAIGWSGSCWSTRWDFARSTRRRRSRRHWAHFSRHRPRRRTMRCGAVARSIWTRCAGKWANRGTRSRPTTSIVRTRRTCTRRSIA